MSFVLEYVQCLVQIPDSAAGGLAGYGMDSSVSQCIFNLHLVVLKYACKLGCGFWGSIDFFKIQNVFRQTWKDCKELLAHGAENLAIIILPLVYVLISCLSQILANLTEVYDEFIRCHVPSIEVSISF